MPLLTRSVPLLARSIVLRLCLGVLLLAPSVLLADGVQTGTIVGRVVDADNLPLPGVDVQLEGFQSKRQAQTDRDGRFRFPQLPIGTYQVDADLLGLMASERDVRTYIGKTTEVRLQLQPATEEAPPEAGSVTREQIQVLAVAPLIDRYETGVRTSISRQFLEQLPLQRFYQSVALLQPGVAGGADGNPNTSGSLRSNNLFLVDGVDTTDPTTGLFGLNLSYDAVKDVDVTTAAPGVDTGRASGAVLNVVTHSGDNRFRGTARWFGTNRDWDADYDALAGLERQVTAANGDATAGSSGELDSTFAVTLAGPLVQDHLWFFGVFEDGSESFLRPTATNAIWDEEASISSNAVKLNWQAGSHSVVGQFTADEASFGFFAPFNQDPGENRASRAPQQLEDLFVLPFPGDLFAVEQRDQAGEFGKLEWNAVLGQNVTLQARGAVQDRTLERSARNRRADVAPHFAPSRYVQDADGFFFGDDFAIFNGVTGLGDENRERQQGNLAGSWFLVAGETDHELKLGLDYQRTESDLRIELPGQTGFDRFTGLPVSGQVFLDNDFSEACFFDGVCSAFDPQTGAFSPNTLLNFWQRPRTGTTQETWALHVSDALTVGRWSVSAGLRFESVTGEGQSGRELVDDTSISPRVAVKYGCQGGRQRPALGGLLPFCRGFSPASCWTTSCVSTPSPATRPIPGLIRSSHRIVPGSTHSSWTIHVGRPLALRGSFACRRRRRIRIWSAPRWRKIVLGFERQLSTHTALRLNLIDRSWSDLWDDRFEFAPEGGLLIELDNLPQAERSYRAVQLQVQRQFADGWQLLGSYTWSEAEGNLYQSNGRSDVRRLRPDHRRQPDQPDRFCALRPHSPAEALRHLSSAHRTG